MKLVWKTRDVRLLVEVNHTSASANSFEPRFVAKCPKQRPAGKKARTADNPLEAKPILGKLSGSAYESFSTIRESIRTYINEPNLQPDSFPLRMSYTVLSRSFRRQQVHIIANFRTISTTTAPAAMSKIIVGPSEIKGERIKGAHWKNDNGTAFKNPWSSFNMPVSMFLAHLITHC